MLYEPAASAGPQAHADWLELLALQADDRNSSYQDLVTVIRRSGSMDAVALGGKFDQGSEGSHLVADDAFAELDARNRACGGQYPFEVHDQYIQLRDEAFEATPYIFMLLLRNFGIAAGLPGAKAASQFEQLSTEAARRYLGGDECGAEAFHFGFPRSGGPANFKDALDQLCRVLAEGGGSQVARARLLRNQKDGKLDLVAWRHFPDRKRGKLVAFGQCAAGGSYELKATELQPAAFTALYLLEPILPNPLLFFFVPWCVDDDSWLKIVANQAIIFDRCRISALLKGAPLADELESKMAQWSASVLHEHVRTPA